MKTFLSLLAVLFIGLKLAGVITWSWWWALAPVWVGAILVLLAFICALFIVCWAGDME